jgi:hypothetical protein
MIEQQEKEALKQLELQWRYFYVNGTLERKFLRNATLTPFVIPQTMELMVSQLVTFIAGERVKEIRYPLDWWQAVKERFLPKWLLKRYPVKYHTWKIDFLYPEIENRGTMKPEIAIYDSQRSSGYPSWEDRPAELPDQEEE